jgi:hypothetical protein
MNGYLIKRYTTISESIDDVFLEKFITTVGELYFVPFLGRVKYDELVNITSAVGASDYLILFRQCFSQYIYYHSLPFIGFQTTAAGIVNRSSKTGGDNPTYKDTTNAIDLLRMEIYNTANSLFERFRNATEEAEKKNYNNAVKAGFYIGD